MSAPECKPEGGKLIPLHRRAANQSDADARLSRRNQVVTNHIVGILTDMLLSWKRPRSSEQRS